MWQLWRRALFDPRGFFAGERPSRRATAAVFGLIGLSCLAPIPLIFVLIQETADGEVPGSLPALVYAAGDTSIAVPGLFAVVLVSAAGIPLIALGIYWTLYYGLSWPVAGERAPRRTAEMVIWGLLPQTLGNLIVVVLLYLAFPVTGIDTGIGITFPGRVVATARDPQSLWVLVEAIGALSVVWSGWLWIHGLVAVRDCSRRSAAVLVGFVLFLTLLLTPPVSRLAEPLLAS